MVRVAAEELEKAADLLEAAEKRHEEHIKQGTATVERMRKLRGKDGVRTASWTKGWLAKLDGLDGGQGQGIGRREGCQGLSAGPGGWWARIDPCREQGLPWAPVVRLWSWAGGCRGPEWATYYWLAGQGGDGPSSLGDIC